LRKFELIAVKQATERWFSTPRRRPRSRAPEHDPGATPHRRRRTPLYARAGAGPRPAVCAPSRGSRLPRLSTPQGALSAAPRVGPSSPPVRCPTARALPGATPVLCTHAGQGESPYWGVTPGAYYDAPSAPLKAATASPGFRPAAHPTETPSTSHCTYYSPPTASSRRRATHLTGAVAPEAGTGRRHGSLPPEAPPPPTLVQIDS
jgi:hypothetical protein